MTTSTGIGVRLAFHKVDEETVATLRKAGPIVEAIMPGAFV